MKRIKKTFLIILIIPAILISCSSSVRAYLDTNNNISLEVSLPKKEFKIFEPMEVLFRYINNGTQNDSIYYIFDDLLHVMKFYLKNEKGEIFNSKVSWDPSLGYLHPEYIVKPKDTLITIMDLNLYGRALRNLDSVYFGKYAYFPVGKYTGYAYVEREGERIFDPPLKSNNIQFEITELNEEDREVLEFFKENEINKTLEQNKYDKIINDFSNNQFLQYVWREKVRYYIRKLHDMKISDKDLTNVYEEFMEIYPNSYKNIHYVQQYINLVANKDITSITNCIDELIKSYPKSIVSIFLNNKYARQLIIDRKLRNNY